MFVHFSVVVTFSLAVLDRAKAGGDLRVQKGRFAGRETGKDLRCGEAYVGCVEVGADNASELFDIAFCEAGVRTRGGSLAAVKAGFDGTGPGVSFAIRYCCRMGIDHVSDVVDGDCFDWHLGSPGLVVKEAPLPGGLFLQDR